jgi:hypothetical protein
MKKNEKNRVLQFEKTYFLFVLAVRLALHFKDEL